MVILERRLIRHVNWTALICGLLLNLIGLLTIYSATSNSVAGDPWYYVRRQLLWMLGGAAVGLLLFRLDYDVLRQRRHYLYFGIIALLLAVLVVGRQINGARSWIPLGAFALQPAEFAKLSLIVMLAHTLDGIDERAGWRQLVPSFAAVGLPAALVLLQPDLGTVLVFGAITFGMLYLAGVNRRILLSLVGLALIAIPLAYFFALKEYQRQRLLIFLNPYRDSLGYGYNVIQSMIAVGSGRFFGRGYLQGTQGHLQFLPEHHTDFIFSVFAEEWGFLGSLVLVGTYGWLLWDAVHSLYQARDRFGMLLVGGIVSMWLFHILENIGMATGIMPVTGIPLPFMSYGGSAELVNMAALAILVNVQTRKSKPLFG